MLKERTEFVRGFLYVAELVIISVNFFVVYFLITHASWFYKLDLIPEAKVLSTPLSLDLYLRVYWTVLAIWAVLLRVRGEYQHVRLQTYYRIVVGYLVNGLLFFGFFSTAAFIFKFHFVSRLFMVSYALSSTMLLLIARVCVLSAAHYYRSKGHNARNIMLVGTGRRAQEFLSLLARHREWGYRVTMLLDNEAAMVGKRVAGHTVVGTIDDMPRLLEENVVDEVVFVVPRAWLKEIEKCILYCEAIGVPATLSTDFFDLDIAYGVPKEMDGFTYLTFETSRLKESELVVKRLVDIIISGVALILLAPVFIFTAVAIKLSSPGPVYFKQVRSGRSGRRFMLYKFRSMVPDAEKKLDSLKEQNEMSGPVFKMENDPRVTGIGRFIRKWSVDELPQFWNVFKGDMSLVGPRPPIPKEVEQYEPWQRRRLSMKPGITCIWQVSGRNNIDFDDWMKLDLQYIDRWSPWLDIKIVILTFKAVFARSGAK
ncbi:MAG: sugar transferase [Micavibrio sp.]|nr:sugar transferase [Micavibrio sp.]